ncbi:hypothetical protein FGI21_10135 [Dickeya zeae]|uniref:Uncharacterized protein n=1 Tax=Dickeya zeae TaxID=204042 RepID=A0AAE7D1S5_9GAMM|nr:hypothetical protein DWG24_17030 [Dickeya zeae]QYM94347.1 hypothetical protein FGI21_10135 [Dickeya zeae]
MLACLLLSGCSTISPFNQQAYEQSVNIKVEALNLMGKAVEPFENNKEEVKALKLDIEKAYEYAKGLPKNQVVSKQWAIIKDPNRNSLGGFLKRWESQKTLSAVFINDAKGIVSDGLDTVIELESGKRKLGN